MITLTVRTVSARLEGDDIPHETVDFYTKYRPDGYQFQPSFQRKKWDGYIRLYNEKTGLFPSGLTDRVYKELTRLGHKVTIIDERVDPAIDIDTDIQVNGIVPRGPQLEAVDACINNCRGVLRASTGFGKTDLMSMVIYALGVPTIILVHTKDLLHQTAKRLETRLDIKVGVIGDGYYEPELVSIVTFPTLARRLAGGLNKAEKLRLKGRLRKGEITEDEYEAKLARSDEDDETRLETIELMGTFHMLIVDEAHHAATAATWAKTLQYCHAFYRFGFSATPFKEPPGSELLLIGTTGELIYDYTLLQAVKDGISVIPIIFSVKYKQAEIDSGYSWNTLYKYAIVENPERNNKIIEIAQNAKRAGRPYVIIVDRIEHGESLSAKLGVPFVSGSTPTGTRKRVRDRVDAGRLEGFVSTVMDEGVDMKEIACLILASGGKAKHRVTQRVGRGVRKGKHEYVVVVDFFDNQNKVMRRQRSARKKAYQALGVPFYEVSNMPDMTNTELMDRFVTGRPADGRQGKMI